MKPLQFAIVRLFLPAIIIAFCRRASLAAHPVAVAIKVAGVSRIAAPDGRSTSRARRRAIGIIGTSAGQALRTLGGRRAPPRGLMTMTAAIFAVVVTTVRCEAARMRRSCQRP